MDGVEVPCFVDPGDARRIWIDWDAAYDAHVEAWERHARVEREIARRENLWEYAVERVVNPFAGRLKDRDHEIVERTRQERRAAAAEQERTVRAAAEATMAAQGFSTTKGRMLGAIPEIEIVFDVQDAGATRRVRFQHLFGPRAATRYKAGRRVDVWIDPDDPDAICPGR